MRCPKCEEGEIRRIVLKLNGEAGYLCDFCEMFWFEGEEMGLDTGRPFTVTDKDELEYVIGTSEGEDQEHRPAHFTGTK